MSYCAKLLAVYLERQRMEAIEGFVMPDTHFRIRELAAMLIGDGCRRALGVAA